MYGTFLQILETRIEARLRQNIEDEILLEHQVTTPPESQHRMSPPNPLDGNKSTLSDLPYRLRGRPIRIFIQVSNDHVHGTLRSRCIATTSTFLRRMMRDDYIHMGGRRLLRAMDMPRENESWMIVEYWIGRSDMTRTATREAPFLTMSYRGVRRDGET